MRNDKELAFSLRRKGSSYNEISKKLGISKSTMHYWFKNLTWSKNIKKKLIKTESELSRKRIVKLVKFNRERWKKWREGHKLEAMNNFDGLKTNTLFVSGIMLYWAEGDSNLKNTTRLTNTDPRMIKIFCDFLVNICNISKKDIRVHLTLYPDLSEKKCKLFWSKKISLPVSQFNKTQFIYGKHPTKRLSHGICSIRAPKSSGLKEQIFIWISLFFKESLKKRV